MRVCTLIDGDKESVMSDIKFDGGLESLHAFINPKKLPPAKETSATTSLLQKEGVEINLSSFADMTLAETSTADEARVLEMKHRIENQNYKINTDVLAQKLLPHLFKTIG